MTEPTQQIDPAVTTLTAKAGDKVDNYTIMEQVGAGGTAIVFRGHDHVLNRNVAIKQLVVPPGEHGEDIRQRAMTEAQMHRQAAASDPKLLVQYIDTINDPRGLFLISEYVDGPSLEWILQEETGPMEQRQALGIIAATAKALEALHKTGVVHRDLKPSNILMPREGGLKLADFGLAAVITEQQSMDLGSVRYMAPEVLQGQPASPKSDLYALGIIAYEMLAGRDKFNDAFRTILRDQRNQSMRWVKWHTNARAKVTPLNQLVENIPESLAQLVARMMEKEPARRVGSADELLAAIRNHFAGGQEPVAPSPHAAMAPPQIDDISQTAEVPRRSKLPIILGATLAVWIIAIGAFFFVQHQQEAREEAEATAALIAAIESADQLIYDQEYERARDAFLAIPGKHPAQFDPNNRRYRDDLVEAGQFKAEALLAADRDDFITAQRKANEYARRMAQWTKQPDTPKTGLSPGNADKMVVEYSRRASFQELVEDIESMLDDGQLDAAIFAIRDLLNNSTETTADEDIQRLQGLERRYKLLLDDERVVKLMDEAKGLRDAGDLRDAVRLLEEETERKGEDLDPRVTALLNDMNRLVVIERIEEDIERAEEDGDMEELLAALKEMQGMQPTQALNERIVDLTNTIDIELARIAIEDGEPEKAKEILNGVRERSPDNAVVPRMLQQIADARGMLEALRAGDRHMDDGEYAEALAQYRTARDLGTDPDGEISEKIQDATGRLHIARSEAALKNRKVDTAQTELDSAKAAHGDTDEIADLQARIDDARNFGELVRQGDQWFEKRAWGRAKAKYIDARKIFEDDVLTQKIRDCDFWIWLDQCDSAILSRNWEAAESALKRAEEIKKNDETAARRAQINNRVR